MFRFLLKGILSLSLIICLNSSVVNAKGQPSPNDVFKQRLEALTEDQKAEILALDKEYNDASGIDAEILITVGTLEACAQAKIHSSEMVELYRSAFVDWRFDRNTEQENLWKANIEKRRKIAYFDQKLWDHKLYIDQMMTLQIISQVIQIGQQKGALANPEACQESVKRLGNYVEQAKTRPIVSVRVARTSSFMTHELCLSYFLNNDLFQTKLKKHNFRPANSQANEHFVKPALKLNEVVSWSLRRPEGYVYVAINEKENFCAIISEGPSDFKSLTSDFHEQTKMLKDSGLLDIHSENSDKDEKEINYHYTIQNADKNKTPVHVKARTPDQDETTPAGTVVTMIKEQIAAR